MTSPAQRPRRWPNAPGILLRPVLAVLLLVPVGALSLQSWQGISDNLAFAERERQGIEYLRSLEQVTVALVDAQSAAVANRTVPREALIRAVEATTSVDARLGEDLRTRERWTGFRAKIEALPERDLTSPDEVYTGYAEATDLLLALYGKVRETSGLIRDPEADTYHLQDSAAEELPEALVAAGRLADVAVLATTRQDADRIRSLTELSAARSGVLEPVEDMIDGLQSAVNNTESRQLSGNLLGRLDAYQVAVDELAAATLISDDTTTVPAGPVASARVSAQTAGVGLSEVMFAELDDLISARIDELRDERLGTVIASGTAALMIIGLVALAISGRPRAGKNRTPAPAPEQQPPSEPEPADRRRRWDLPADWSEPEPTGPGAARSAPGLHSRDGMVTERDGEAMRWGRTDAAR